MILRKCLQINAAKVAIQFNTRPGNSSCRDIQSATKPSAANRARRTPGNGVGKVRPFGAMEKTIAKVSPLARADQRLCWSKGISQPGSGLARKVAFPFSNSATRLKG